MADEPGNFILAGKDIKTVISIDGHPKVITITQRQGVLLSAIAKMGSVVQAAEYTGVSLATARAWLRKKEVREWVRERQAWYAAVTGKDFYWLQNILAETVEGKRDLNAQQMAAASLYAKMRGYVEPAGGARPGSGPIAAERHIGPKEDFKFLTHEDSQPKP